MASTSQRYLSSERDSVEEDAPFDQWADQAVRLRDRLLPSVQRLDAAGMLRVRDLRTGDLHHALGARLQDDGVAIEILTQTDAPAPSRSPRRKPPARSIARSRRKRS